MDSNSKGNTNYNINNNNSFNFNLRRSGSGSAASSVSLLGSFAENVMPQNTFNSDGEAGPKKTGRLLKKKKKKKIPVSPNVDDVNDPRVVRSDHHQSPLNNHNHNHHHHDTQETHNNNSNNNNNFTERTAKTRNATENVAIHILGLDSAGGEATANLGEPSAMNHNPHERRTRARSLVFQNAPNANASATEEFHEKKSTTRRNKRREATLNFARAAVDDYGQLEPVELAMLQTQQQAALNSSPTQATEIFGVAEILAAVELLNEREFALLHEATHKQNGSLANSLMYSGGAWYLPVVTQCDKDEDQNGIFFSMEEGLAIAVCGKRMTINVASILLRVLMLVAAGGVLFYALPEALLVHHGYVFDPVTTLLFCSLAGGLLARLCGIPPLLFILLMSILYANLGSPGNLTGGIVPEIRSIVSKIGLTIILLRSGLSMSWSTIKPAAPNILSMAFVPMVVEIVVHGFTASKLMDYGEDAGLWPFMQSMMCAPAASAVVGSTVLLMRTWGYGSSRGPGVILLPAAVLDMVLGIWGINFMISLLFRKPDDSIGWLVGQGLLQIFGGPVVGVLCGVVWFWILKILFREAKLLPHGKYSRNFLRRTARNALFLFVMIGFLLIFMGYKYGCAGGGGLAVAFLGAAAKFLLTKQDAPEHHLIVKDKMYSYLTSFWDLCACPLLFSLGPSSISTKSMFEGDFIWRAVVCVVVGVSARIFTCFVCSYTYPMTKSERIIAVISSAGRATVQVALGSYAVTHVTSDPNSTPDELRFAKQVYDTSIVGVLLMTPIAVVLLTRVAPRFWLTDEQHAELDKKEKKRKNKEAVARGEHPLVDRSSSSSSSASSSSDDDSDENNNHPNKHNNSVDRAAIAKNGGSRKLAPLPDKGSAAKNNSRSHNNDDDDHSGEFYDFAYSKQQVEKSPTQADKGFSPTEMKNVSTTRINDDDSRGRKKSFAGVGFI